MSEKYLGREFDIHGGGMDLLFPHHECEIAQNEASRGTQGVHYWVHNNLITIEGKKMGKSLGNFITLPELFSGNHPKLVKAYAPMTVRFFILQAHYRGTLDFSNEALQAAEKALDKIMGAYEDLKKLAAPLGIKPTVKGTEGNPAEAMAYGEYVDDTAPDTLPEGVSPEVAAVFNGVYDALCDDMNTPVALAHFFDAVKLTNGAKDGTVKLSAADYEVLLRLWDDIVFGVLGLRGEHSAAASSDGHVVKGLMDIVLKERAEAKAAKDWARSDAIRDALKAAGVTVKDTKNGAEWTID